MSDRNVKWHLYTAQAVEEELHTNASCGLSRKEARSRYRKYGANRLFDPKGKDHFKKYKAILTDPALLLLLFACILSIFFSNHSTGILTLICFACGIGYAFRSFYLEKRLEADIAAYRVPTVTVLRDGKPFTTSARNVVVGDVLLLHAGDIVPCDCRLIEEKGLHVLTLYPDQNQKAVYSELPKKADIVYPYGSSVYAPFAENILYGGSEITLGYATAIAVETGEHTFLGAISDFRIPAEIGGDKNGSDTAFVRPYIKIYTLALFASLVPLTLIAILAFSAEIDFLNLFLSLSALVGGSSQAFLLLHLQLPLVHLKRDCFCGTQTKDRVIVKSDRVLPRLSAVTDLIVLGHCGSSDGKMHLMGAATGKGEQTLDHPNTELSSISQALWLYRTALSTRNLKILPHDSFAVVYDELSCISGFDAESVKMRLLQASFVTPYEKKEQIVSVKMRNAEYMLLFSERVSWI